MSRARVTVMGVSMQVEYDYTPAEPEQRWGDCPHPGSPAGADILCVTVGGRDITALLSDSAINDIEEAVLGEHDDGPDPDAWRDQMLDDRREREAA